MRTKRNVARVVVFTIGIALQFASFYVSQFEQAPWVLRIVSPASVNGMVAVGLLAGERPLGPDDKGFQEISEIAKGRLESVRPNEGWDKINVRKYEPQGAHTITGMGIDLGGVSVRASLSNGKGVKLRTDYLSSELDTLRKRDIFRWSLSLLVLGVAIVQIPLFFVEAGPRAQNTVGKTCEYLSHVPPM